MLFLLALTGCSKDEAGNDSDAPVPVRFEAGSPEVFKTRTEINTLDDLKAPEKNPNGFGVFAYYTGATAWKSAKASATPNFMYNQQVTWDVTNSVWIYTPVKYWPNDNNPADNTGATGSQTHSYVSFFAYAPYSDMSSHPSSGVTAIRANSATGAPVLTYIWAEYADLLYASQTDRYKYDSNDANDNGRVGDVVSFTFRHALVYIEHLKVRLQENTDRTVTLKSLRIGYKTSGTFDLGNAEWTSTSGSGSRIIRDTDLTVTAYTAESAHDLGGSPLLVIPDITYTIEYKIGETEYTHNDVSIPGLTIGNKYTIIFTIDGDVIKVDTQKFTEQW